MRIEGGRFSGRLGLGLSRAQSSGLFSAIDTDRDGKKTVFKNHLYINVIFFTKTGSGQTQGKLKNRPFSQE
jgi:hypothetical protein